MLVLRFIILSLLSTVLVAGDNSRGETDTENGKIFFPEDVPAKHYHHEHNLGRGFPPGFQHSPEYHKRDSFLGHTDTIVSSDSLYDQEVSKDNSLEIPLEFIQNLNEHDVSDLLLNFVEGDANLNPSTSFIASRFGEDDGARNAAKMPQPAGCTPEITTVELAKSNDPSVLYIPQCTKIERCGGCCSHNLLSCQPVEVESIPYQVYKTKYTGGKKLKAIQKEIVVLDRHIKCRCDCKVKQENCNKYQQYKKAECRCACTNTDEEKKCYKNSQKLWNPDLCACQCRDVFECSSGYFFDNLECRCTPEISKRSSSKRRTEN